MTAIEVESQEGSKLVNLQSLVEFAKEGIVSKTFLERPEVKMVLFCMSKGQMLSEHTSSMPAAIHTLKGSSKIQLGEKENSCPPGTWIYMPANTVHAVSAEEDLVFLLTLFKRG